MADNAILFKYMAKSVGMTHGIIPSFMAKPWGSVRTFLTTISTPPHDHIISCQAVAGERVHSRPKINSLIDILCRHVHVSLRDKSGRNIFGLTDEQMKAGGRKDASSKDVQFISQEAEWFLAGLLDGLSDGVSSHGSS